MKDQRSTSGQAAIQTVAKGIAGLLLIGGVIALFSSFQIAAVMVGSGTILWRSAPHVAAKLEGWGR